MPRFPIPPLARTIVDVRMTKAHHQPQPHPKGCDYSDDPMPFQVSMS